MHLNKKSGSIIQDHKEKGENTMLKDNRAVLNHNNNIFGVATGLVIGGMIGAVTMYFTAPQSGKRSRALIQQKGFELLDRTNEIVEDSLEQVRQESKKLARGGRHKARDVMHQGEEKIAEQLAHMSEIVENGKKRILGSLGW
jgi:gas vesicle protein